MAWILLLLAFLCGLHQNRVAGQDITLNPSYNPMFVKEGDKLTIECKVKNIPKNQDAEFVHMDSGDARTVNFKVSKKVTMENNKAVTTIIITKESPVATDNGQYSCASGGHEKSFQLVVTPVLTLSSNVTVGDDVTIKCDPNTNFKQMDLIWTKNGKPVDRITGVADRVKFGERNFTLTLQKAVEDDAGEYECTMTFFRGNSFMEQSFKDVAKMFGKPHFRIDDGDMSLSLSGNDSIDLSCDALGYPKPDVTWLKDDEVIQSNSRVVIKDTDTGSQFKIEKIIWRDTGTYVCNVENTLGRKQRSFKVAIEGVISSAPYFRCGLSQLFLLASVLFLTL